MIWVVQFLEKQQLIKSKFISKDVMLYKMKVLSIFKAWNSVSPLDWAKWVDWLMSTHTLHASRPTLWKPISILINLMIIDIYCLVLILIYKVKKGSSSDPNFLPWKDLD